MINTLWVWWLNRERTRYRSDIPPMWPTDRRARGLLCIFQNRKRKEKRKDDISFDNYICKESQNKIGVYFFDRSEVYETKN